MAALIVDKIRRLSRMVWTLLNSLFNLVHYEQQVKREVKRIHISDHRCNERLKVKIVRYSRNWSVSNLEGTEPQIWENLISPQKPTSRQPRAETLMDLRPSHTFCVFIIVRYSRNWSVSNLEGVEPKIADYRVYSTFLTVSSGSVLFSRSNLLKRKDLFISREPNLRFERISVSKIKLV